LIWLTGDNPHPLDSTVLPSLSAYLNGGGNLFITGQDVEGCQDTSFYHNYLGASVIDSSAYRLRADGVDGDSISSGLTFLIVGSPGANNQDSPTIISPLGGADSIFSYRLGGCCGLRYENGFKTVYLSYGFEAIASLELADTVMMRILQWFGVPVGIEEHVLSQPVSGVFLVSPNPFTNLTRISFGNVQRAQGIELKIFDATGRLVKQWDYSTIGKSDCIPWDGRDNSGRKLPSGVYFLKLEAGDYSATEKLLLIR